MRQNVSKNEMPKILTSNLSCLNLFFKCCIMLHCSLAISVFSLNPCSWTGFCDSYLEYWKWWTTSLDFIPWECRKIIQPHSRPLLLRGVGWERRNAWTVVWSRRLNLFLFILKWVKSTLEFCQWCHQVQSYSLAKSSCFILFHWQLWAW